jgi:rod shape-determining protein MreC
VDVKVARTGARGVLTGLSRQEAYRCAIEYLDRGADVKVGDLVVTSGLGGVFPSGIPVGSVSAIKDAGFGLYQSVEVRPSVPFGEQSVVLVLVGENNPAAATVRPETGRL